MSSSSTTAVAGNGENRGAVLLACTLTFGILAFLIVTLRLVFRISRRTIGPSDWCIGLAMVLSFTHTVFDAICVTKWGYGRHEADLPPDIRNGQGALLLFYMGQIDFKLTILFTKLSLFFIYRGLFRTVDTFWVRLSSSANNVTMVLVVGYYSAAFIVSIFECTPIQKAWIPSLAGTCINTNAFLYATNAFTILTSLLIISIPIPVLLRTKHRGSEGTQLLALILLGLLDTAVSIARIALLATSAALQTKPDPSWNLVTSTSVATVELNVGIIAASLVVMRPCFRAIYHVFSVPLQSNLQGKSNGAYSYSCNSNSNSKPQKEDAIIKTVDIELSSRAVSHEDICEVKDQF